MQESYHDQFAVLELADELGLLAVPLLDVDQLVTLHADGGLNRGGDGDVLAERGGERERAFTGRQVAPGGSERGQPLGKGKRKHKGKKRGRRRAGAGMTCPPLAGAR